MGGGRWTEWREEKGKRPSEQVARDGVYRRVKMDRTQICPRLGEGHGADENLPAEVESPPEELVRDAEGTARFEKAGAARQSKR